MVALPAFDLLAVARTALTATASAITTLTDLLPASDIPPASADPTVAEPPPGRVPPGDSRSLRRGELFALIYRSGISVITRAGTVGQRGVWRVVDYPSPARAATAYANQCSALLSDGYIDYAD